MKALDVVELVVWTSLLAVTFILYFIGIRRPNKFKGHYGQIYSDLGQVNPEKTARQRQGKNGTQGARVSLRMKKRRQTSPIGRELESSKSTSFLSQENQPLDFNLFNTLKGYEWVRSFTLDGHSLEVFVNSRMISEADAKWAIRHTVNLGRKVDFVVYYVTAHHFEWLNGNAKFGAPKHLYFTNCKTGHKEICTTACSFAGRYIVTSGHGSGEGIEYFRDPAMRNSVGICTFHSLWRKSDIAIIDNEGLPIQQVHVGRAQATIFAGSVWNASKTESYLRNAILHTVRGELSCNLKAVWDQDLDIEGWAITDVGTPETAPSCQDGDSGALLTTARNGMPCYALGVLTGRKTYRTSKASIITSLYALSLGPSYGDIRKLIMRDREQDSA